MPSFVCRWSLLPLLLSCLLLAACGTDPAEQGPSSVPGHPTPLTAAPYVEDEVLVRFQTEGLQAAAVGAPLPGLLELERIAVKTILPVAQGMNATANRAGSITATATVSRFRLPPGLSVSAAIEQLQASPEVVYAEPNYRVFRAATVPNDPFFSKQWGLSNSGQTLRGDKGTITGTPGADIGAGSAWDLASGSRSIIIATIDSGIDYNHPDLAANIWNNQGETGSDSLGQDKAGNGIDDDGNGYIDDVRGWNFVTNTPNPMDDDVDGHGTHVAGIIGAEGNNSIGGSGINWQVSLMPLKFLDRDGYGTVFNAAKAIRYAIAHGARVINASYTYPNACTDSISEFDVNTERDAITEARAAGVLLVAAAGNYGCNNEIFPFYPGSHSLDNILSVAATDPNDSKVSWSNYGATSVDLGAPGLNIYSTIRTGLSGMDGQPGYNFMSGTSMAAPFVSGAAALLWSQNPALSYTEVRELLLTSVTPLPSLTGKVVSGGRLDLAKALQTDVSLPAPAAPSDLSADQITPEAVDLSWRDLSNNETGFFLERADATDFATIGQTSPNVNSFTDTTAPDGSSVRYRVKTVAGIRSSVYSNEVGVTIPLKAPTNLTALGEVDSGIQLLWSNPALRAEFFAVERRLATATDFTEVATTPVTNTSYLDQTAVAEVSYRYRVRAYNTATGYSAYSAEVEGLRPLPGTAKKSSDSRCFIATAAWGSPLAKEVAALRRFRDRVLLPSEFGRCLVESYYRLSPPLAHQVAEHPWLAALVRLSLRPLVWLADLATPAAAMERRPPVVPDPTEVPGELLLRFHPEVSPARAEALIREQGCTVLERLPLEQGTVFRLQLPSRLTVAAARQRFAALPDVLYAEPNRRVGIRPGAPRGNP